MEFFVFLSVILKKFPLFSNQQERLIIADNLSLILKTKTQKSEYLKTDYYLQQTFKIR